MATGRLFLLLSVACGRVGFTPAAADSDGDIDAGFERCALGPFSPSLQHVAVLNSTTLDWGPSLSADDLTLYFSSGRGGNEDLYRATRASVTSAWTSATPIVELAAAGDEEGNPSISTDDLTLYWGQNKLWRSTRATPTAAWGPAELLLDESAGMVELQGPEISFDDRSLYFTANVTILDRDLFVMTRTDPAAAFGPPVRVEGVNSIDEDAWPAIARDELELLFSSSRSGVSTLYVASRSDRTAPWGTPVPVLPGMTDLFDPDLSSDLTTLWFATQGPGSVGTYDLYTVTRACQ